MSTKRYHILMDTWLMGQPVRASDGAPVSGLTEEQIKQGLAAGTIAEYSGKDDEGFVAPNGITEPIKNQQHTSITQDSVAMIQGNLTGDAQKSLAEAEGEEAKGKAKK